MTIKNGLVADADEVLNAFGPIFKNQANLIWNENLDEIGPLNDGFWNSSLNKFVNNGLPTFKNLFYNSLPVNTDNIDSAGDINDGPIVFPAEVIDDFQDGILDTNIWSATNVTDASETSGYILVSRAGNSNDSAILTADQINGVDFNQESTLLIHFKSVTRRSGTPADIKIQLVDESAHVVDIVSNFGIGLNTTAYNLFIRMEIDPTGNNVDVYQNDVNGVGTPVSVSISSLTDGNKWYLRFRATTGTDTSDGGYMYISFVRYLTSTPVSNKTFITAAHTASSTITNAILSVSDEPTNGLITYYLSANNGSNYEEVTLSKIHRFTNTGTQLKFKAEMDSAAGGLVPFFEGFAVNYNLY